MTSAKSIFISYRRRTSIDITGRIYDRLATHFGEDSVFKDVDSIPFGVNFRNHLEREVSHCPVLLAVIDPDWLAVADDRGRPKLANPADWVRIEIETALQRDRLVIPVLVGGATLPEESALPEGLKALAYRQSAQVRCDPDFHRDLDRLIHRVEGVFSSLAATTSAPANLIDELAAAIATASQITQPPAAPILGRRRWLKLMGLGLVSGGSALALHRRGPALQTLTTGDIHRAVPGLATLPERLHQAIGHLERSEALATPEAQLEEPESEEPALPRQYIYESVSVDEFGVGVAQVKHSTPAYQELWLDGPGGPVALPLTAIAGGQFVQGAPATEPGHDPTQPSQAILSVESFWMGTQPITQGQWRAVTQLPRVNRDLEANPSHFTGDALPVEQVSWLEAVEFCDRLTRFAADRGAELPNTNPSQPTLHRFRLPSETEWEYACRAKTTTPFHTGQTLTTNLANYNGTQPYRQEPVGKFRGMTMPVGIFGKANDFGLYDMHGNVLEWCSPGDGGPPKDNWRVVRGGSWQSPPQDCRSAYRAGFKADTRSNQIGFRIVAEVS
ncbi:MAG: SUMF1/EgtB/PvdO family nonheme iron enzyme [Nodosilinea sp.]